jgi:histidyl-tRNA synthetase
MPDIMKNVIEPRLLKGFRDFLPAEQSGRQVMLDCITRAFEVCGFAPLSTPAIEYADILLGKYGDEGEKLLYKFEDNGGRQVALRYDLTVPLARVVAQYRDIPKPFRRYQLGTVWRAEKPAHGRFREFMQCDADIVGTASPLADADCIAAGIMGLQSLGLKKFEVRIGHRGVLNDILQQFGVDSPEQQTAVLRNLDRIDKSGRDAVVELLKEQGIAGAAAMVSAISGADTSFDKDNLPVVMSESGEMALTHLKGVLSALVSMGFGDVIKVDLSIARGLDYYTGTVYETTLSELPSVGSIMSGGRYDCLLETYGMPEVPAVGISIGVDRLFAALVELGQAPQAGAGPTAVVCMFGADLLDSALGLVSVIRAAGVSCEPTVEPDAKLKKQLTNAVRRGAKYVILLGEDEVRQGMVMVKNMTTGEQVSVARDEVAAVLK